MNKRIIVLFSLSLLIPPYYLRSMYQEATRAQQISLIRVGGFVNESNLPLNTVEKCLVNRDSEYSKEVKQLTKSLEELQYEFGDIQNVENIYKESSTFHHITLWATLLFMSGNHILQLTSPSVKKFWEEDLRALCCVDLGFIVFSLLSWGDRYYRSEQLERYRNVLNETASLQALAPFYNKESVTDADIKNNPIPLIAFGKFIRESGIDTNELKGCLTDRSLEYRTELEKVRRRIEHPYEKIKNIEEFEKEVKKSRIIQIVLFWATLATMSGNRVFSLFSSKLRKTLDGNHKVIKGIELSLIALNLLFYFEQEFCTMRLTNYKKTLDDKKSLETLNPFFSQMNQ